MLGVNTLLGDPFAPCLLFQVTLPSGADSIPHLIVPSLEYGIRRIHGILSAVEQSPVLCWLPEVVSELPSEQQWQVGVALG